MEHESDVIRKERANYINQVKSLSARKNGIVIYGAGIYGKQLHSLLAKNHICVRAFCVTNTEGNRAEECGLPVKSLGAVVAEDQNDLYLIAAKAPNDYFMIRELNRHGIHDYINVPMYFHEILDELYWRPTLEITSRVGCKMHCRYCPQDLFIRRYNVHNRPVEMSFDMFKHCIDKTPQNLVVDFAGYAEPFLNPAVIDMMEYCLDIGRDMRLYTTMRGLTANTFERVKDIPFLSVVLHLPDKHNYADIPVTSDYYVMLEKFLTARKADGSPFVDRANAQCEPNPDVLKAVHGRVRISWDTIMDWAGNIEDDSILSSSTKYGKIFCEISAGLNHNILLPDGSVTLCCMDWGMRHVLGNLMVHDYDEIVDGKEMQRIRCEMASEGAEGSLLCRQCTSALKIQL